MAYKIKEILPDVVFENATVLYPKFLFRTRLKYQQDRNEAQCSIRDIPKVSLPDMKLEDIPEVEGVPESGNETTETLSTSTPRQGTLRRTASVNIPLLKRPPSPPHILLNDYIEFIQQKSSDTFR